MESWYTMVIPIAQIQMAPTFVDVCGDPDSWNTAFAILDHGILWDMWY